MATFLALVVLVAGALGAVGWTGALAPRITTEVGGIEEPGASVALAEVTNDGPLAIEVESLEWESRGLSAVAVGLAPIGVRIPPMALLSFPGSRDAGLSDDLTAGIGDAVPFTLAAGESRVVVARGVPSCSVPSFDALRLEVRTRLGAHRTVTTGGGPLSRAGTCP